ncbi:hypothetical protein EVAR_48984_1 [Eumeta japonica]|uniref:Uncharacterized protein n=1 Tax=Eumeta variegata TaxID=151549 RepID=A0A4C1Z1I9_EUMVA|nr:hypothetical protein EVAR_48984_1 [Eumeta japonica]
MISITPLIELLAVSSKTRINSIPQVKPRQHTFFSTLLHLSNRTVRSPNFPRVLPHPRTGGMICPVFRFRRLDASGAARAIAAPRLERADIEAATDELSLHKASDEAVVIGIEKHRSTPTYTQRNWLRSRRGNTTLASCGGGIQYWLRRRADVRKILNSFSFCRQ